MAHIKIETTLKGLFGSFVLLNYSENTLVFENTEVLNTLMCLDAMNTVVLKTEVSPKTAFFCLNGNFSLYLFFSKLKYSSKLKYLLAQR